MAFVTLDSNRNITGRFARPQPGLDGFAEIDDNDKRLVELVENKIIQQIAEIETTITPRRMREAALTTAGKAWLKAQDDAIAALRAQL